jgi:hypothetical protein
MKDTNQKMVNIFFQNSKNQNGLSIVWTTRFGCKKALFLAIILGGDFF